MAGGRGVPAAAATVAAALALALLPAAGASAALERDRQSLLWDGQWWSPGSLAGTSVALSNGGTRAVVGSPTQSWAGPAEAGIVTVFNRSSNAGGGFGWRSIATVASPDPGAQDWFGASVAVDAAETTLVVGIPQDDVDGRANQGRAAVFVETGAGLQFSTYLTVAAGAANDRSGTSVAVSDDGTTVLVGSPGDDGGRGSATVFTRDPAGAWTERRTLTRVGRSAGDGLGRRVALSGDGTLAVAGVPGYDAAGRVNVGAAVPYTRSAGAWTEGSLLTRFGGQAQDGLGSAVAVSVDGAYVVLGAPGYSGTRGAAVVFHREAGWVQQETLFRAGAVANEQVGSSVAVSDDGGTVVLGAPYVSGAAGAEAGAVLPFTRSGTTWTAGSQLTRVNAAAIEHLGTSVALTADGQMALGGAPDAQVGDKRTGAAVSFAAGPPRLVGPATVVGTGVVGSPLTGLPPVFDPAMTSIPWFWLRCSRAIVADDPETEAVCVPMADAVAALVPTADMVGGHVAVAYQSTSSVAYHMSVSASVPVVAGDGAGAPVATAPPTLSGPARAGREITTTTGTWDPAAASTVVTWWRCSAEGAGTTDPPADCTVIEGANGTTYRPGADDLGSHLRARVVATDAAGAASATTAASDAVVGIWAKRTRASTRSTYAWKRLAGTGSSGARKLRRVSGPCRVSGRTLRTRGGGACVVRAVVTREAPYPRLVTRIRLRVR